MKKILLLVVLALVAYFLYTRVGESSDPSFGVYTIEMPDRSRTPSLTVIEKLRPGLDCGNFEPRRAEFVTDFLEACAGCQLKNANCQDNLTAEQLKIFDNRVVDTPYFSYEKGGLLSRQDFRILFPALNETEAKGVCMELRQYLKNHFLFFIGGRTECVRKSDDL